MSNYKSLEYDDNMEESKHDGKGPSLKKDIFDVSDKVVEENKMPHSRFDRSQSTVI